MASPIILPHPRKLQAEIEEISHRLRQIQLNLAIKDRDVAIRLTDLEARTERLTIRDKHPVKRLAEVERVMKVLHKRIRALEQEVFPATLPMYKPSPERAAPAPTAANAPGS